MQCVGPLQHLCVFLNLCDCACANVGLIDCVAEFFLRKTSTEKMQHSQVDFYCVCNAVLFYFVFMLHCGKEREAPGPLGNAEGLFGE